MAISLKFLSSKSSNSNNRPRFRSRETWGKLVGMLLTNSIPAVKITCYQEKQEKEGLTEVGAAQLILAQTQAKNRGLKRRAGTKKVDKRGSDLDTRARILITSLIQSKNVREQEYLIIAR